MLLAFGSIAVTIMLLSYWLEPRSRWFVLLFAAGSGLTSAYSGLAEVYPITVVEAIWTLVALQRFQRRRRAEIARWASSQDLSPQRLAECPACD